MFGPLSPEEAARIARLPVVNRARGSRLYTVGGRRWLDCWADGGRAVLGHRPGGVSLRLKNEIDRGLYAAYPNRWNDRLAKALLRLFPGYRSVRIFRNFERALSAISWEQWPTDPLDLPAETDFISGPAWGRPLLPNHPKGDFLLPILPVPGFSEAQAVLYARDPGNLPPSDSVSPLILAAFTRSCSVLGEGEIQKRGEDSDLWEMRGPYMVYRGEEKAYGEIYAAFFARAVLIAPSPLRPSVYPRDISPGEKALLDVSIRR